MFAYHDSRDTGYRKPYGAQAVGCPVELGIDVQGAPVAAVKLRTWADGVGETLYDMACEGEGLGEDALHYAVQLKPERLGEVWYHFVIELADGAVKRYGAVPGRIGGVGQLYDWEPPSFLLSVYDPGMTPPSWFEPIGGYLYDDGSDHAIEEVAQAAFENYPADAFRSAFPWIPAGRQLLALDKACWNTPLPACTGGMFVPFAMGEDVFGLWYAEKGGIAVCALANASRSASREVAVPLMGEEASELIGGYGLEVVPADADRAPEAGTVFPHAERSVKVHLGPVGSALLCFHASQRLQRPMEGGLGVLAHITSVPGASEQLPEGGEAALPGTLGAPSRDFVDWLAGGGVRYWQMLPVNPTDEFGSPYAGISAFAGNVRLLEPAGAEADEHSDLEAYAAFCKKESDWLEPYAAFMAIRRKVGLGLSWQDWPEAYRTYDPGIVDSEGDLRMYAEECRREQFTFQRQWDDLHDHARAAGVLLVGDMPIYVSPDSADVWAHPELFCLGDDGRPQVVAGCAPDAFAADGQVWGNPVYDWGALRDSGYSWWLRRLERAFELYDLVRLDHFIGFARYFAIPAGQPATEGAYRQGPGLDLFKAAYGEFGPLPVIAEDLGLITPAVRGLMAACGFPGMDILQFADGGDPLSGYHPRPHKIAYTGTHDNQTLLGYVKGRYPQVDEQEALGKLIDSVVTCPAPVCIVPLQDVIGLDDAARMNVPGVAEGNWTWQAQHQQVQQASDKLRELVKLHEESR